MQIKFKPVQPLELPPHDYDTFDEILRDEFKLIQASAPGQEIVKFFGDGKFEVDGRIPVKMIKETVFMAMRRRTMQLIAIAKQKDADDNLLT